MKTISLLLLLALLAGCTPAAPTPTPEPRLSSCEYLERWTPWFKMMTDRAAVAFEDYSNENFNNEPLEAHIFFLETLRDEVEETQVEAASSEMRRQTLNVIDLGLTVFETLRDEGPAEMSRPRFKELFEQYTDDLWEVMRISNELRYKCP